MGDRERNAGVARAAYFFLGCGAYPDGPVAFVFDADTVLSRSASFTPFDSGSIERHAEPANAGLRASWDSTAKDHFLAEHLGHGFDVVPFASAFIAAHFRDPVDYVTRGHGSEPDFPAYHGLASAAADRRAWTIEVQAHHDVPLTLGRPGVCDIVAARPSLLEELPDDLVASARVARAENEVLESIAERIVEQIQREAA